MKNLPTSTIIAGGIALVCLFGGATATTAALGQVAHEHQQTVAVAKHAAACKAQSKNWKDAFTSVTDATSSFLSAFPYGQVPDFADAKKSITLAKLGNC